MTAKEDNKTILSWKVESDVLGTLGAHVTLTGEIGDISTYVIEKTVDLLAVQMKRSLLRAIKENDIIITNDTSNHPR